MRGVVKEVPSGDTLVVSAGAGKPGAAEKRITLASVVAPKLVRGPQAPAGLCKMAWPRAPPRPCACRRAGLPLPIPQRRWVG